MTDLTRNITWEEAEVKFPECSAHWDLLYQHCSENLQAPNLYIKKVLGVGEILIAEILGHSSYTWNQTASEWISDDVPIDQTLTADDVTVSVDAESLRLHSASGVDLSISMHRIKAMASMTKCVGYASPLGANECEECKAAEEAFKDSDMKPRISLTSWEPL